MDKLHNRVPTGFPVRFCACFDLILSVLAKKRQTRAHPPPNMPENDIEMSTPVFWLKACCLSALRTRGNTPAGGENSPLESFLTRCQPWNASRRRPVRASLCRPADRTERLPPPFRSGARHPLWQVLTWSPVAGGGTCSLISLFLGREKKKTQKVKLTDSTERETISDDQTLLSSHLILKHIFKQYLFICNCTFKCACTETEKTSRLLETVAKATGFPRCSM